MAYKFISSLYGEVAIGTCDIITSARQITYGVVGGNFMDNQAFSSRVSGVQDGDVYEVGDYGSRPNLRWSFSRMNRNGTAVIAGYVDGYPDWTSQNRQLAANVPSYVSGQPTGTNWAHVGIYDATIRTNPTDTPRHGLVLLWSYDPPTPETVIITGWTLSIGSATNIESWLEYYPSNFGIIPEDPYAPGGLSDAGGGDGNFDFSSTDIPVPALPTIGAYNTGFTTMYRPTEAELQALSQYMWSGTFDPNNLRKLFANPMETIIGLTIQPTATVSGVNHPQSVPAELLVGNISTGITMGKLAEQYYELDCGTVAIPPKWGAYLDYEPFTKLSLYLPYIGFVPISASDCMRGSVRVVYHVDVMSGTCVAWVYCVSNRGQDGHVLYNYAGNVAAVCPVTEGQYANAILASLNIGGAIIGGMTSNNPAAFYATLGQVANTAISMATPQVQRSGQTGATAGLMEIQYPYLVLTVPRMCTPANQDKYIGYPSYVTRTIGECTGYTEIQVSHLEGVPCTSEESEEIIRLLGQGVIL